MTYHLSREGESYGPYDELQVAELVASGKFATTDLIYSEEIGDWTQIGLVLPQAAEAPAQVAPPVIPGANAIASSVVSAGSSQLQVPTAAWIGDSIRRDKPVSVLARYAFTFGLLTIVPFFGLFLSPVAIILAIVSMIRMGGKPYGGGEWTRSVLAIVISVGMGLFSYAAYKGLDTDTNPSPAPTQTRETNDA